MSDKVHSVHAVGFDSQSLSTDGTTAMVVLKISTGEDSEPQPFAITIPVENLKAFRSILSALIDKMIAQPGNAIPKFPREVSIGFSDDVGNAPLGNGGAIPWRDCVMIRLDNQGEDEAMYVMSKKDGLTLSENLRTGIMPRLTMRERREWQTKATLKRPELIRP